MGKCRHRLRKWDKNNAINNRVLIDRIHNQLKTIQQTQNDIYSRHMERSLKKQLEDTWAKDEE